MAATTSTTDIAQTILAQCLVALNQVSQLLAQVNAQAAQVAADTGAADTSAADAAASAAAAAADAATAQPAPASSAFAVRTMLFAKQTSGVTINDGTPVDGSFLAPQAWQSGAWVSGPAQTGTWLNVSGLALADGDAGLFVRTA